MDIIRRSFVVYDIQLHLISIKFDKLIYFWVGDEDYKCHDLQCAFPLKSFKDAKCTGSTLIGDLDGISQEISKALTIRFGCGVFMSINIKENDYNILSKFQEELFRRIASKTSGNKCGICIHEHINIIPHILSALSCF